MSTPSEASFRCQLKGGRLCVLNSGKMYDVTDFVDRHPGGRELIEKHVGEDVTQVMKSEELHKHSPAAFKILEKYYIGEYQTTNGIVHRHKESNGHTNGYHTGQSNGHTKEVVQFDDLVDWSKPIFWQVGGLGEKYEDWVHSPVDTQLRLFYSDFVETFSKAYWWTVPPFWVPICLWFLIDSCQRFYADAVYWNLSGIGRVEVPMICVPLLFLVGFLMWTLVEYIVHRWLFHVKPPSNSKFLITAHFILHGQHHKSPMDKTRLVFPHVPAIILSFIIYHIYWFLAPKAIMHLFFAGTVFGYLCYDLTHYYLHHGNPSLQYFKDLKTYHVKHHFKSQNLGFGISSKLWDFPFGTLIR